MGLLLQVWACRVARITTAIGPSWRGWVWAGAARRRGSPHRALWVPCPARPVGRGRPAWGAAGGPGGHRDRAIGVVVGGQLRSRWPPGGGSLAAEPGAVAAGPAVPRAGRAGRHRTAGRL